MLIKSPHTNGKGMKKKRKKKRNQLLKLRTTILNKSNYTAMVILAK